MRLYANCYELLSEVYREVVEMGILVKPKSMQNKIVEGNEDYHTKEIRSYQYNLLSLSLENLLFNPIEVKDWANAEFAERVINGKNSTLGYTDTVEFRNGYSHTTKINPEGYVNPGTAWLLREDVWKQFLVESSEGPKFDYSYNERLQWLGSLGRIIEELERNPDTRQAVLSIYSKSDILYMGGKRRIPCSMYYNFHIRPDATGEPRLYIIYHQRSADAVVHFGNDIWLAWKLMEYVASKVGVKPGNLIHNIDSLHVYKKDWVKLEEMRNNLPSRYNKLYKDEE